MIKIESNNIENLNKLSSELNKKARLFKEKSYAIDITRYENLLLRQDISVEKKKKNIIKNLHNTIIKTFSIDVDKIKNKKKMLESLKNNLWLCRATLSKLRDINYYLETTFLEEVGLIKKAFEFKRLNKKELMEKESFHIDKKETKKLDYLVYKFISKIIFLDKKLLKKYKKEEEEITQTKKIEIKDIEKILKKQSELLCHFEAKLPPPQKAKIKLFNKKIFTHWTSRIFALLIAIENEHIKENLILKKLRKNSKLKNKIDKQIKHIIKEKEEMFRLKEKRAMSLKNISKMEKEMHNVLMHYTTSSML